MVEGQWACLCQMEELQMAGLRSGVQYHLEVQGHQILGLGHCSVRRQMAQGVRRKEVRRKEADQLACLFLKDEVCLRVRLYTGI